MYLFIYCSKAKVIMINLDIQLKQTHLIANAQIINAVNIAYQRPVLALSPKHKPCQQISCMRLANSQYCLKMDKRQATVQVLHFIPNVNILILFQKLSEDKKSILF